MCAYRYSDNIHTEMLTNTKRFPDLNVFCKTLYSQMRHFLA